MANQIAWVTNPQGEVEEDIPLWRAFTGQSPEEIKGSGWASALHPDDRERTTSVWNDAIGMKSYYETEYRVRRHDGVYRDMLARSVPVLSDNGNIIEWVGTCIDITERKRIENALRESEERYRTLFETMTQAFALVEVVYDGGGNPIDLRVLAVNPAIERQTGIKAEQITGRTLGELFPSVEPIPFDRSLKVLETGEPVQFEERVGPLDRWLEISVSKIDERRFAAMLWDITERKRAEETLRQNAELLEHAPVLVRSLDDEIMLWNSGMQDIYGYTVEEALGRVGLELLGSEYPQPIEEIRDALVRDGRWEGEIQRTRKDGTAIAVLVLQKIHRDASGRPAAVIEIDTDITGRRQAEEQLERLRSEFYGVISHELKTPLTVIKGTAAWASPRQDFRRSG